MSATETLSDSAASFTRYSRTVSSSAPVATMVQMMMKLVRSPVSAEITAAANRINTSGLWNRLRNSNGRDRRRRSPKVLGP